VRPKFLADENIDSDLVLGLYRRVGSWEYLGGTTYSSSSCGENGAGGAQSASSADRSASVKKSAWEAVRHTALWSWSLRALTAGSSNGRPPGSVTGPACTSHMLDSHSTSGQPRRTMARSSRATRYCAAIADTQIVAISHTPSHPLSRTASTATIKPVGDRMGGGDPDLSHSEARTGSGFGLTKPRG
jgi:hypothetical protein